MIKITDKSQCCGCNGCVLRCPKGCITMVEDEEGFLYPQVDAAMCIECGLCEKVCPVLNPYEAKRPETVYAAKNLNTEERLASSSGGMFILLAREVINHGGAVFGACFDDVWEVEHRCAETVSDLAPMMRSKYMQSRIENSFSQAEQMLRDGRQVMFVGTPCQIAALRHFLRKDYENLLAVDFVCHGVPSPGVWRKYLKSIITSRKTTNPTIYSVNFREKQNGGYNWKKFGFVVKECDNDEPAIVSDTFSDNFYMKAFLQNFSLRPSCYNCVTKDGASNSDITIADFWGIDKSNPDFDDNKGCSLVLVHSTRGAQALKLIQQKSTVINADYVVATSFNPAYYASVAMQKNRDKFWKTWWETGSVVTAVNEATKVSLTSRILSFPRRILGKIRRICK